jgi:serine/threonine protein kinase
MDIVHQDVKCTNILLCRRGRIKLGDFGMARTLIPQSPSVVPPASHGSPYWMAPELLQDTTTSLSVKNDIWSLGVSLIEMAETYPPYFKTDLPASAMHKIANEAAPVLKHPESHDPNLVNFLSHCLVKDPLMRAQASELLQHPFIKACPRPFEALSMVCERASRHSGA